MLKLSACIAMGLLVAACGGDDGAQGPQGLQGPPGTPGSPGVVPPPTASATGDLAGTVTDVAIDAAAGQRVTVTFSLQNAAGQPVVGAETKDFDFYIAKRVAGDNVKPEYWQSYVNRSEQEDTGVTVLAGGAERAKPTAVAGSPGVYRYSFCTPLASVATFQYYGSGNSEPAGCAALVSNSGVISGAAWDAFRPELKLAYDAAAATRIAIVGRDGALVNVVRDFVPSQLPALATVTTAQRVTNASCGACHAESSAKRDKLLFGEKNRGHLGRRYMVEVCVMCHNPSSFDSVNSTATTWKTIDLKVTLHDLHAAEFPQGGSFGGVSNIRNPAADIVGVDTGIPEGARPRFNGAPGVINCRNCHDNQNDKVLPFQPANRAAADKTAWQTSISKQACQSCHDGTIGTPPIDFSNHFGNQPDNSQCALCHGLGRSSPVAFAHTTPYSTPNNPDLYPGAKVVKYEIASVTVDAATGAPTVKFRVLVGDSFATLNSINLKNPPVGVCILANCQNGNGAAGLNFRVAWAKPMIQPTALNSGPAIAEPADWNNFGASASGRQYWNDQTNLGSGKVAFDQPVSTTVNAALLAIMSDPDVNGYQTVTLPAPARFPADPVYSTLTLRAVALESYLVINNYNISGEAVIKGVDGSNTVRREIVDMLSCDTCHERVGFHSNAGRANNAEYCAACHNPEITSSNLFSGFASYPVGTPSVFFSQRPNSFKGMIHSIHAAQIRKAQDPADAFNFLRGNPLGTGGSGPMKFQDVVYPAQVADCQTCHKPNTYGVPTGAGLAWSATDVSPALGTTNPDAGAAADATNLLHDPLKTLRIGPATAACGSCHNSPDAKIHYIINATGLGESCNVCHGPGAVFESHKN